MNQPTRESAEAASTEVSLQHSIKDAAAYAVMMGIGETYLSAFALFLKASTPQIGLLASLPPLLGSLAQIVSAWLGRLAGRRKPIILAGAGLQALAWLPITHPLRMLYQRDIETDLESLMDPTAELEIRKVRLAVEHDRLGLGVPDFGIVHDRQRDRVIGLAALQEHRLL